MYFHIIFHNSHQNADYDLEIGMRILLGLGAGLLFYYPPDLLKVLTYFLTLDNPLPQCPFK